MARAGPRLLRILSEFAAAGDADSAAARLCDVCASVTLMSGAGIIVIAGDAPPTSVCTTDPLSALVDDLQCTLGEGPGIDAHRGGRPMLEPNLADPDPTRWPAFSRPAVDAGVAAVFGFPLRVGAARVGALSLFRRQPGPLTDGQHADALVVADVSARSILAMQAGAPPAVLAAELAAGADMMLVVHQAAGMVAAQLDVGVGEALVRLRAHAFGNDRRLADIADDVVGRRLRFTHDCDTAG